MTSVPPVPQLDRPDVEVIDDDGYRRSRLPSDLLRLLVSLLIAAIGLLLASVFNNVTVGIAVEVVDAFDGLPAALVVTVILAVQLLAWLIPIVVFGLLLLWRRYRRLLLVGLSVLLAAAMAWAVQSEVTARFVPPALDVAPPSWVCDNVGAVDEGAIGADDPQAVQDLVTKPGEAVGTVFGTHACVPGDGFPSTVYLAGLIAGFSTLTPWLNRRWRRAGWIVLLVFVTVRLIDGLLIPVDALLIGALSYAIGAGVLLIFGSPDRRPRGGDVAEALDRHGFSLTRVAPADVAARSSSPFMVETSDGRRLFAKVRSPEERAADVLYRGYRTVRLSGFGDERPFTSLRREAEHEAVMSLTATSAGVRTPQLVRVADVGSNSIVLLFDAVDGTTLSETDEGIVVSDATLRSAWNQLALLRRTREAHRNLSPNNIMVDAEGQVWLLDFGFAELAASPRDLRGDVAQMLVSLSLVAGPSRAVGSAVDVLGADAVADAGPRLQPTAVGSTLGAALKRHKGLLGQIQDEVLSQTGVEEYELEKLQRIQPRTVLTAVMLGLAFYFLIPQLAEVDFGEIAGADWKWFPLVVLFSLLTYVGAAVALMGSVPDRLRFWPTLWAQLAASFFNRLVPAKVGGMAANLRYLQKNGVEATVGVAAIGVNNIGGVIVHISLLVIFVTTAGRSATDAISLPSGQAVLVGLVVVLTLAGGVMLLPWGRRFFLGKLWPVLRKAGAGITAVAASPKKLLMLFGGAFVITMAYAFALWYSLAAFGGGIGFVAVTAVYLAGSALAQVAPTPGGIGAAEAALIAGLTAFGLDAAVAVPAVFLYRFATFWLPILPGWLAYKRLESQGIF
jgi:undecaprenyl-diphosphatase